jgi:peroxiredoxin
MSLRSVGLVCVIQLFASSLGLAAPHKPVELGDKVPNFSFLDTDKIRRNYSDLPPREAYVFIFGLLDCPLARRQAPTLAALYKEFRAKGVEFIGLYGRPDQSILDTASYRIEMNLPFLMGKDLPEPDVSHPENEQFAGEILGVTRSPQVVVIDKSGKLLYRGRVDGRVGHGGSRPAGNITEGELHRSLRLLLSGKPELAQTPAEGCTLDFDKPKLPDATNLTFYKDIQPILSRHCWDCHREKGEAPFPLVSYDDVSGYADTILSFVRAEIMPPAFSQKKVYRFLNHREITQPEKLTLEAWIRGGTPEGSPSESTVRPPQAVTEWKIGKPDVILTFRNDFVVKAGQSEAYLSAVLPTAFARDTWVESIEILPTNKNVTHHANLLYWNVKEKLRTGEGASANTFLCGYVPGATPLETRKLGPGVGVLIPAFSVLGFQIHFVSSGKDELANLRVGIRYARGPIKRKLHNMMFSIYENGVFKIPAGDGDIRLTANKTAPDDMDLVGFYPHMHLRGKAMWLNAGRGAAEKRVAEVPAYNFSWQMAYILTPGSVLIPKGTPLTFHALYDNSDMNTFNPNPRLSPINGERTEDEMFMGFLFYLKPQEKLDIKVNPKNGHVILMPEWLTNPFGR